MAAPVRDSSVILDARGCYNSDLILLICKTSGKRNSVSFCLPEI